MKFILGKKLEMTQIFDEEGNAVPVTLVKAGPCKITQIKTEEKDNYNAVQIGFEEKEKNIKKTEKEKPFRYLKEFRVSEKELEDYEEGDEIDVSTFEKDTQVKVSGISKGKGFQGVMKRHGFSGLPASHGTKDKARSPGSIGSAYPQRVWPGRKMPGRTGSERTTIDSLEVVEVDPEKNILAIKGSVPGPKGNLLEIKESQ